MVHMPVGVDTGKCRHQEAAYDPDAEQIRWALLWIGLASTSSAGFSNVWSCLGPPARRRSELAHFLHDLGAYLSAPILLIWNNASGTVVYDNQMGASDTADPTMAIGGGDIVIHAQ